MTNILLSSTPDYDDENAVGAVLQAIVTHGGGEVVTVLMAQVGGACGIAASLIEASTNSGLVWDWWDVEMRTLDRSVMWWHSEDLDFIDEVHYFWQHPDRDGTLIDAARALGIPAWEYGDSLLAERK